MIIAKPRYYRILILTWTLGISGILILHFFGWYFRQESIGKKAMSAVGVKSHITVKEIGDEQITDAFEAIISYEVGRKGPFATLRIYPSEIAVGSFNAATSGSAETGPVQIWPVPDDILPKGGGGSPRWNRGSVIRQIVVSEDEWGFTNSFITPINIDDDFKPEFFIGQSRDASLRANPIESGTYIVDYDEKTRRWTIQSYVGIISYFLPDGVAWKIQLIIIWLLLLSAPIFLKKSDNPKRDTVQFMVLSFAVSLLIWFFPILASLAMPIFIVTTAILLLILGPAASKK